MEKDVRNKIYAEAKAKLDANRRPRDRRTYLEQIDEEPNLLTEVEKEVFVDVQMSMCRFTDEIIEELKAEGNW